MTVQCMKQDAIDVKMGKHGDGIGIIRSLVDSDLPEVEKYVNRLFDESQILVGAGTETTSMALSNLIYYLLSNPVILKRLKKDLEDAIPDENVVPTLAQVESLPFLVSFSHTLLWCDSILMTWPECYD